jgi:transcriptional regulator with XRE-family HTH domain
MVKNPRNRYLYEKVRFLRAKGKSYNEIKADLGVSKGNISLWCRDIRLSDEQKKRLLQKYLDAPGLGGKANHEKREKEITFLTAKAMEEIKLLTSDTFKIAGAVMYWAEGSKTQNTSITNADPRVITFMVRWFQSMFEIPPNQLKAHLHIHYGNDERKIKNYWARVTRIPLKNFGKSFIKPRGTGHRTNILPNGIIRIRVLGMGTENLRIRILAWTQKIYDLSRQYK